MKDFILFCKLVQPLPSSLQLPSSCHCHCSCRPRHRPHPHPPPLLLSPLLSLSLLPLLARQPCHRLHRLAALTLLVACHPHCRHSCCRRHRPCCCSPRTLVAVTIALATLLATRVAIVIALFVASAFTRPPPLSPSCRIKWGRGGPYRPGAQSYFGRHRRCRHHRRPLSRPRVRPGGAGPMMHGIPTPGRQLAPMWGGCCQRSCSRRHPPCRPTVVAAVVVC